MGALPLVVPALLLLASSLLFGSALASRGIVPRLLALWLLAYAQIVLLTEVLSEARLIGARGYLAGHVVLFGAALVLWQRAGRPRLAIGPGELLGPAKSFVSEHPVLSLFAAAVVALAAVNIAWCFLYPPLDGDANAYHLPRAYYFTTLGTARHFPVSDFRLTQTPPNASFVFAWMLAFSRRFGGLHLSQAFAGFALACAVAGLARLSGRDRAGSLFAAIVSLTFPIAILEMGTSQTDLTAASCGAAAAYFGLRLLVSEEGERSRDALLFGLSLGLGLGTKLTVFFLVPGLVIGLVLLSRSLRGGVMRLVLLGVSGVGGFAVLGAYNYVLNLMETGNPIAAPEGFSHFFSDRPDMRRNVVVTAMRYARQLFDSSPFEGRAAFGPLALVLLALSPVVAVAGISSWRRRRDRAGLVRAFLVLFALSYPAVYLATNPPFYAEGTRYFLLPVAILSAAVFPEIFGPGIRRATAFAVGALALWVAGTTVRAGEGGVRRVAWQTPVFEEHLEETVIAKLATLLPAAFPPGATLGIVSEYNDTVFHLFRALPDLNFVPVSENDVPRLVREGRLAAAVVGEFRNAAGQGVTKPGFPLPRNVLCVPNPEEFFRLYPEQFGARLSARDGKVEAVLPIDRNALWAAETFVVRVPTGIARAIGTRVSLRLPSPAGASFPEVDVACEGLSVRAESDADGLTVPIPAACITSGRVYADLALTRVPAAGALVVTGEARLTPTP